MSLLHSANFVYRHHIGTVYGYFSSRGLQQLFLYNEGNPKPYLLHTTSNILLGKLLIVLLDRYFSGIPEQFEQIPLDISGGTMFQQKIWNVLRKIPWGKTCTYGELAVQTGLPKKYARAVGQALRRNPIPIIIPCHRVLGGNNTLGGFSAGIDWKNKLLTIEKIVLRNK